jgi:hypothetical protein
MHKRETGTSSDDREPDSERSIPHGTDEHANDDPTPPAGPSTDRHASRGQPTSPAETDDTGDTDARER